jgi:hypothetical protein
MLRARSDEQTSKTGRNSSDFLTQGADKASGDFVNGFETFTFVGGVRLDEDMSGAAR